MTDHSYSAAQSPCPSVAPKPPEIETNCHAPALAFNADEYLNFLADCDWTEAQKREFIEELWKIVLGFVDLGFGIHPVQLISTLETDSSRLLDSFNSATNKESCPAIAIEAQEKEEVDE